MIRHPLFAFLPALLLVLSLGCAGLPIGDGDDDDATPYEPPGLWADLDHSERITYMEELVLPAMEEIFVGENAADYPGISCESCHGENPTDVDYEMPNGLEPLNLDDFPLEDSEDPEIAETAHFMSEEVKPVMANLLDRQPFPQGDFGCFSCHEEE